MSKELKENERMDDLEIKGYKIIQNKDMFCFGIDAVLLADYANSKSNDKVIDMCTGNGVIPLIMCAKDKGSKFLGIDILDKNIDMANRSIAYNNVEDKVSMICKDIKEIKTIVKPGDYNIVTCNPPYMVNDSGYKNINSDKLVARHEVMCTIDDILKSAAYILNTKGKMYMIHRPNRLSDIMYSARKHKLEPKRLTFVHSTQNKKPSMILMELIKDGKSDLIVEEPLIIYKENGDYSDKILKMYGKL